VTGSVIAPTFGAAREGARRGSGVSCDSFRVEDVAAALAGADTTPAVG
jgi:hypothetical protein